MTVYWIVGITALVLLLLFCTWCLVRINYPKRYCVNCVHLYRPDPQQRVCQKCMNLSHFERKKTC